MAHEDEEQDGARCDHGEHPRRPACGLSLDERVDDGDERQADQHDADTVEFETGVGDTSRQ